jgi:hypothetical protein
MGVGLGFAIKTVAKVALGTAGSIGGAAGIVAGAAYSIIRSNMKGKWNIITEI